MDKEELHKDIVTNLRACLVSTKGKCDLHQINRDYRLLMGGSIPYEKLGYRTLEQFVCSIPSLSTTRINNTLYVDAKETEKSAHISALVNRQKTRVRQRPSSYGSTRSFKLKWQSKSARKSYESSPRLSTVKHNQFVNHSSTSPKKSTISAQLAARLGPKVEPPVPVTLPEENQIADSYDVVTKTKQRLIKKMEGMQIQNLKFSNKKNWASKDSDTENNPLEDETLNYFPRYDQDVLAPKWSNLQKDSSIDSEFITPEVPKVSEENATVFISTGDHLADLLNFASVYGLDEPQIKVISVQSKLKEPACFHCHIKVGAHSYSSYPNDYSNETDAQQEAARRALEELMPIYKRKKSFLISDEQDVLARIPPIVQSHYYGLFKDQLEADYVEKYSEQLPGNWLQIVDMLPNISVTPCLDKFVLRFCKIGEKGIGDLMPFVSSISVPTNSTTFDDNGTLMAEITCPVSASEIWCRQINTPESAEFELMISSLDRYCNSLGKLERVESIDIGGYYVTTVSELERIWCRVRVFDVTDTYVNCFCIDYGDELVVTRNALYALPRQFARDQAQAFVCRLAGIEEFYEASKTSKYISKLTGMIVYVHLQENVFADDLTHNVLLVDVENDTIINEEVQKSLEHALYTSPELTDTPSEVYLTHVEDTGLVYVQVPYFGSKQLNSLLEELETSLNNNEITLTCKPVTSQNSIDKLYFVKNNDNQHWCRTRILDWSPIKPNFAQIQYVDYGTTAIINVNQIVMYPLEDLNEMVVKFTDQAKPAIFALNTIPEKFSQIIRRLVPPNELVLAKVDSWDSDGLPCLKFFKRSEPDNLLFSINDAIAVKNEVIKSNINGKSQSLKIQKLMSFKQSEDSKVPSTGVLKSPSVPAIGNYFDVKIPLAVNPYNFFVQPFASKKQLSVLMGELQEKYKDSQNSPLSITDVVPGKIYASKYKHEKYDEEMWLRTSVIKVIHEGSISVFYCDYGYSGNLTLQQLFPLDDSFLSLPFQAIRAKLADIQPKLSKWSTDDCKFFENLVCGKSLVSIIRDFEKDEYHQSDTVLILQLIDTSTKIDIYIDRILIEAGIAVAQ